MDPEGIREVFYAECGAAADYGLRQALRSLPFPVRFKESFFYGVHLPLTLPLPKRLDTTLQQHVGLHAYDAVLLADIDAVVLDADDLLNLLAYVEGGGGLLLLAGPHSFTKAQRNWGPLREALPADVSVQPQKRTKLWNDPFPAEPTPPPAAVVLGASHPITRGLNGPLGVAHSVHAMAPKPGSHVLARAGDAPVAVVGTYGRGRVVTIAAEPGAEADCLYRTLAWGDALRQSLAWLMKRDGDLVVTNCSWGASALALGTGRDFTVDLAPETPEPVTARLWLSQADPGWLAVGRGPQFGAPREGPVEIRGQQVGFRFTPPEPGLWRLALEVRGPNWANRRETLVEVPSPLGLQVRLRSPGYVTAPGRTLLLNCAATVPLMVQVAIHDAAGEAVVALPDVSPGPLDVPLPLLADGEYEVVAKAAGETARLRFLVAEPLRQIGLAFVGWAGGPTEERVRWWHDYFRQRGFNAFSTGLLPPPGAAPTPDTQSLAFAQYLVQRDGGQLWSEPGAALLSTHAHYGAEGTKPTTPCVFHPDYPAALRRLLAERFAGAAAAPRMASLEILDEPHLMRANVCHCECCREAFRQRYGFELPTWDEALAARDARTRAYFEWVVDYAAEAFRRGYETWKSFGPGPSLHHVLCAVGNGTVSAAHAIAEDLPWAPHADFLEFDCYNYMYPNWRGSDQLRWNEFHWMAGHFRFLARRSKQRFGFYIQVTDRDVPVTAFDPLRTPAETLYTALGAGAKTFHLMAKGSFTNTQNCREAKFEALATEVRQVQRLAPLLDRAEPPRSRVAVIFNWHDRLYRVPPHRLPPGYVGLGFYGRDHRPYDTLWPYHKAPINLAELVVRAFGETEVVDQRALHEGVLEDYGGALLCGVDYLAEEDAGAVRRFVERGGALLCDHVPTHDTSGRSSQALAPLFMRAAVHFYDEVTLTRGAGGHTLLFSTDLNELYTGSVERDDVRLRGLIERATHDFFADAGLRPWVASSNVLLEANLLLTTESVVLVVVNHGDERQGGRVTVTGPPVPVAHAVDLMTTLPQPFQRTAAGLEFELELGEREGRIIVLYPAVPAQVGLSLDRPTVARGERLAFTVQLTTADGAPAQGDHLLEVTVTDAAGEPRQRFSGQFCTSGGSWRLDESLPVNARRGAWTISVFERFSARRVKGQVTVT